MDTPKAGRKRHRRVIRLSEADQRRLASGEIADPTEAVYRRETAPSAALAQEETSTGNAPRVRRRRTKNTPVYDRDDERILREVPPHFGKI